MQHLFMNLMSFLAFEFQIDFIGFKTILMMNCISLKMLEVITNANFLNTKRNK